MAKTKYYANIFIKKGIELQISYIESDIFCFYHFSLLGHNLSLAILNETRYKEPLLNIPDRFSVPSNVPPTYLCVYSYLGEKYKYMKG